MPPLDSELLVAALRPLELPDEELRELAAAVVSLPRSGVRLRPGTEASCLPYPSFPVPWHPQGRFLDITAAGSFRPGNQLAFAAGEYYTQDPGSLLALALLQPQPGESICDLCAAPGGKSTGILEAIGEEGWLLANEAVHSRLAVLQFNLARHGATRYAVTGYDPDRLAAYLPNHFDAVLVDAPCSGQSLVGRGKQSVSAFLPQTIEHCVARQARILAAAAQLVRPGGRLVYSTCTLAYNENEGVIRGFLAGHPEWQLASAPDLAAIAGGLQTEWGVRVWPQRHGCGGAFAARIIRTGSSPATSDSTSDSGSPRSERPSSARGNRVPTNLDFSEWGELTLSNLQVLGEQCFGWPADLPNGWQAITASGPEVAFRKGQTWFPSYALAMRRDVHWRPQQCWELDDLAARRYVQGQVVPGTQRGWSVATWQSHPLGWLKGDGRQGKNHLPKGGRLNS